jgi:hypothetical protein
MLGDIIADSRATSPGIRIGILPRQAPDGKVLKTFLNEIVCILRTLVT